MESKRIEEIKERLESATVGPWKIYKTEDGTCIGTVDRHPQLKDAVPVVAMSIRIEEPKRQIWMNEENAEFIAHSYEDIEWLIKENERLQTMINISGREQNSLPGPRNPRGYLKDLLSDVICAVVDERNNTITCSESDIDNLKHVINTLDTYKSALSSSDFSKYEEDK